MQSNHLSKASSPYLLQHANNPVHWWEWGNDALQYAQFENKPILLSIGYAACHWCHVMAHESFEDSETADIMNQYFVNIKVDREERPDIDQIYMSALHGMGEQGGWPLTMFLIPKGEPFWGGTYFPIVASHGRPSFKQVLMSLQKTYYEAPDNISHNVFHVKQFLERGNLLESDDGNQVTSAHVKKFSQDILGLVDWVNGGIKGAPKFPNAPINEAMYRGYISNGNNENREAFIQCVRSLAQGGIYDHLGGGLARYATDHNWVIPHFEKMLYDNGHFLRHLSWAYGISGDALFAKRIDETISWLKKEMLLEGGSFSASLDADSEGVEGKFYVWQLDEIKDLLGEDTEFFCSHYDISASGNWEGSNILNRPLKKGLLSDEEERRLSQCREKLLLARSNRIRPGLDDKILTDWNGYIIRGLVEASAVLRKNEYLDLACGAYDSIMGLANGNLLPHSHRAGSGIFPCFAQDYAAMINAACSLYEATQNLDYLKDAQNFVTQLCEHYEDGQGSFYLTHDSDSDLIIRPRGDQDEANPSANSQILEGLCRLNVCLTECPYDQTIENLANSLYARLKKTGFGSAGFMNALDTYFSMKEIIIVAKNKEDAEPYLGLFWQNPEPARIIRVVLDKSELATYQKMAIDEFHKNPVTVLICQNQTCQLPITSLDDLSKRLTKS
jgi:uncharacterized protein YyaL (SSP411 family)